MAVLATYELWEYDESGEYQGAHPLGFRTVKDLRDAKREIEKTLAKGHTMRTVCRFDGPYYFHDTNELAVKE